jgi:hypothetical protein
VCHHCSAGREYEEREEYQERNGGVDIELSEGSSHMFDTAGNQGSHTRCCNK